MNLSLSSRLHVPTLRNSFQALAPRGGRTLAMQSATQNGSMLLAEHVRPSQESAEDSAAGKKARTGPSASEDEDDDPRLTASVKAVLLKCLPSEIDRITPIIARTLNLDFERSLEFTRATCQGEIAKVRQVLRPSPASGTVLQPVYPCYSEYVELYVAERYLCGCPICGARAGLHGSC